MKHCIIVGAGFGLSAAVARRFGAEGYAVGLISRNEGSLEKLTTQLAEHNITVNFSVADAGDHEALLNAISELEAKTAPCTCLVYNAAVLNSALALNLTIDSIREEFKVNVEGAFTAASAVADGMKQRGSGSILFTGGGLALEPYPEWASLALGKSALRSLSFSLHKELAPHGVLVSVIAVCGIVAANTPFDPDAIAAEYWRLANSAVSVENRELIFQPHGTDPFYNDPNRVHSNTTQTPAHANVTGDTYNP